MYFHNFWKNSHEIAETANKVFIKTVNQRTAKRPGEANQQHQLHSMKKFIFNQVARLQSLTSLTRKSFNRYFLKVFFMDIIFLPSYLPSYLPHSHSLPPPSILSYWLTNWLTDWLTDWPIDWPTNRPANWSINPPIYLPIYIYIHIYISSFTTGSIVDKSMKKKNMLLLEKPSSILLKDKNTKQKMILEVEKLPITLYGPL